MDDAKQRIDTTGDHIWLRYATQFTANGRARTIEMSIPVPLGASQQQREALLHEAEAGMLQLSNHVEKIATQMMRGQGPAPSSQSSGSATSSFSPTRPASVSAPQTAEQPAQQSAPIRSRESLPEPTPAVQRNEAPIRQSVGASMPSSSGGDVPNNLSIPQFVKLVGETLGLDSKQAMARLNVKSLSGINLRKAYEQLKQMTPQENERELEQAVQPHNRAVKETMVPASRPATNSAPISNSSSAQLNAARNPPAYQSNDVRNTPRPAIGFDEEEQEPDEDRALLDELDELDFSEELTNQQRARARELIKELREFGGMTVASANRLLVLNNIISSQISEPQLIQLIQGVWNLNAAKKLKIEQAEKLISWAKEDDFVNEVEDVLKLLEEEG